MAEPRLTTAQLAAWAALADAATPGPWRAGTVEREGKVWVNHRDGIAGPVLGERCLLNMNLHFPHTADRAFIAAAREAVPALVAEVRALRSENYDLRAEVRRLNAAVAVERDIAKSTRREERKTWTRLDEAVVALIEECAALCDAAATKADAECTAAGDRHDFDASLRHEGRADAARELAAAIRARLAVRRG